MPDYFFHVCASLVSGLVLSFFLERLLKPQPVPVWQRPRAAVIVHIALWVLIYAIEFLQFARPWIAMVLANTICVVLIAVNNVKFRTLREPFLYQDFEYFVDAVKYPRLYIPFFGWGRAISCILAVVLGLVVLVPLEEPVAQSWGGLEYWVVLLTLLALTVILLSVSGRDLAIIRYSPEQDIHTAGFLATLWYYLLADKKTTEAVFEQSTLGLTPASRPQTSAGLPHVMVVQSESFFDIRRWLPQVKRDVLQQFERVCSESVCHGTLEVSAWGANTVRTEFALLTGLDVDRLGVHKFNPYRRLVSADTPSLVRHYKNLGYRTIAIHPYSQQFYRRDRVFPTLGFDEFLDIQHFDSAERAGPFVSDAAVSALIERILQDNQKSGGPPLFIFVITMENHGPLHLEARDLRDADEDFQQALPAGCEDIGTYLKHLRHADAMIGRLTQALSRSTQRAGVLAWYGDHVPIMDQAYQVLGVPSRCTDYFVWSSAHQRASTVQAMPVHTLARAILDVSNQAS